MNKSLSAIIAAAAIFSSCSTTTVRLATYNVGAFSKYSNNSTEMVASMMKELNVDIISLNELDSMASRTGYHYQLAEFADAMGEGWDYRFGKAIPIPGGSYGTGIAVSPEFRVIDSYVIPLGQFDGSEERVMTVIETDKFVFATTHLDHRSINAQNRQAGHIDSWMKEKYGSGRKPVILCGDFNAEPGSEVLSIFKNGWTPISKELNSFPSTGPAKCIDYIMIMDNGAKYRVNDTYIPTEFKSGDVKVASDHLPVFAEIELK